MYSLRRSFQAVYTLSGHKAEHRTAELLFQKNRIATTIYSRSAKEEESYGIECEV